MTKTGVILFLFLFTITFNIEAQKISFGAKAGGGGSFFRNYQSGYPIKFGKSLGAGLFMNYGLNNFLSTQVELMYTQKGNDLPLLLSSGNSTGDVIREELHYIEIPLLLKASIDKKISPFFLAGISPGYNIVSKVKVKSENINQKINYIHTIDLGLIGAVGAELKFGRISPFIEARFGYGLLPVYTGIVKNKNTMLLFSGGIRFK